ncbi:aryl-alcohol oxidase-like protein [Artomyces pyxidatus]|uniref:Aryl-alcohol oxidase-like protein n=1 Tax=Artomyces pyxidatus TaxID=48021 RepID=A0ACB8TDS9_9AGAM|nr:aryl-alcohol oxidase-like protein [Artomyces pyxidatus]
MTTLDFTAVSQKEYDFIIVGGEHLFKFTVAGTAGAVIASRLSENPDFKILVLEAGGRGDGIVETIVPLLASQAQGKPYNWPYVTESQAGLQGRTVSYPGGKVVGGSSMVNFMFTTRGSSEDWDRLAKATGDEGWAWESILPLAKKIETWVPPTDGRDTTGDYDPEAHGDNGPVLISLPNSVSGLNKKLMQAVQEVDGFSYNKDINAGSPLGVGWLPSTHGGGVRSSSNTYLKLAEGRANLDLVTGAQVTKLIFAPDSEDKEPAVVGVEFASDAESPRFEVKASKEVILSAGSIGSPKILLLSGIGEKSALESLDIKVVKDLPDVGKNLRDHTMTFNQWTVDTKETRDEISRDPEVGAAAQQLFGTKQTALAIGFFRIPETDPIWSKPGIQDTSAGLNTPQYELLLGDGYVGVLQPDPNVKNFFTVAAANLAPSARGSVTLKSNDPFEAALVDPNLLGEEIDVHIAIEAVKKARAYMTAPVYQAYNPIEWGPHATAHTDEELEAYVRSNSITVWHPTSTLALSSKGSPDGVLDPDLKVKGVKGLRVADASVFPYSPAAHPQIPVYIVGERAAEIIASQHRK